MKIGGDPQYISFTSVIYYSTLPTMDICIELVFLRVFLQKKLGSLTPKLAFWTSAFPRKGRNKPEPVLSRVFQLRNPAFFHFFVSLHILIK